MAQSALTFDANAGVKSTIYTGRAPKAILDLKAAIRYLRHFDKQMLGDAERIITDGTSAGGAMSALMGATGNNPEYADMLKAMGAADERDDVFASVCYCPIIDLDMQKYLNYVVSTQPLKGVPAFDSQIEGINGASGENEVFGDETGNSVNFTDYTSQKNGTTLTDAIRQNVRLMNPMSFIGDGKPSVAPHWYIRHGARDRDTAFPVPVNFATKLQNAGKDVNFILAWNRPHSGDYALDELFEWIAKICKQSPYGEQLR